MLIIFKNLSGNILKKNKKKTLMWNLKSLLCSAKSLMYIDKFVKYCGNIETINLIFKFFLKVLISEVPFLKRKKYKDKSAKD